MLDTKWCYTSIMSRSACGTTSAERGIIFPLQLHVEPHQNEAYVQIQEWEKASYHTHDKMIYITVSCRSLCCLVDPVHHIMVIQEKAHRLPVDAEKEPKDHIANLLKMPQVRTDSHPRTILTVATKENIASPSCLWIYFWGKMSIR